MRGEWVRLAVVWRCLKRREHGRPLSASIKLIGRLKAGDLRARGHIELQPQRALADLLSFDLLTAEDWEEVHLYPLRNQAIRHIDGYDPRRVDDGRFRWRIHNIWIDRNDALTTFDLMRPKPAAAEGETSPEVKGDLPLQRKGAGGKPIKEHWFRLAGALAHHVAFHGYPEHQHELVELAQDWFSRAHLSGDKREIQHMVAAMYAESERLQER